MTVQAATPARVSGMRAFMIVWFGQVISLLGTAMSRFALTIWAWEITGQATALALVGFFSFAPVVLASPLAGALVDRWNRKVMLMLSDLLAGVSTVAVLTLYLTGNLQIWHLYIAGAVAGIGEAFQFPAFSAAISVMLPKSQYTRANGLLSLAESSAAIAAPILAVILLTTVGIGGVLSIDVVTFVFAVSAVALISIPNPQRTESGSEASGSLWQESIYGFRYILKRPSLLGLQLVFLVGNFFGNIGIILLAPMVLARTGNDEAALGTVQAAMGIGGVIGGVLLSSWGGPKRRIHGVLLGFTVSGFFEQVVMGMGRSLTMWVPAALLAMTAVPFINGSNQAIWQAKVAPDVQGRVFASRRLIAQVSAPVAMLMAGPLADRVFEPAMQPGAALASIFGPLVGTGPGAGIALLMVLTGLVNTALGLIGYTVPAVRDAEKRLPDHDQSG